MSPLHKAERPMRHEELESILTLEPPNVQWYTQDVSTTATGSIDGTFDGSALIFQPVGCLEAVRCMHEDNGAQSHPLQLATTFIPPFRLPMALSATL